LLREAEWTGSALSVPSIVRSRHPEANSDQKRRRVSSRRPRRCLEVTSFNRARGHQLRPGETGRVGGMSPIGWLILVGIIVVVAALVFVVVRRRRRGGGVIATRGKR
jgi:LPXTG-motif cell wall-anchored protein